MGQVHRFVAVEHVVIDKSVLTRLRLRDGERKSRDFIDQMIFQTTDKLCRIEQLIKAGKQVEALEEVKNLIRVSAGCGMICLNDVAYDLVDCLMTGDNTATQAVLGRLLRLGEDSLFALIDYTDRTIV